MNEMKIRRIFRLMICMTLALSIGTFFVAPSAKVSAASRGWERRYVNGNGVRLRQEGYSGGTVLELMYDGEKVNFYPDVFGTDPEYNYMFRVKTLKYGYVDHHYVRTSP